MRDQHPTSDELLDLALAAPIGQDRDQPAEADHFAAVGAHLSDCVACRVRFTRLQHAGEPAEPSEEVLSHLVAEGPVLNDDVRAFISAVSRDRAQPSEIWKVGIDDTALVWVRRIVNPSTVDVIPVVFDTSMADNESILIAAERTPLATPLAALTSIRIQIHSDTFVNKLGTLDMAESVEEVLEAARTGRPHHVREVGPPIESQNDPRIEYRQLVNDILSDLTPVVYAERLKAEEDQEFSAAERARQRIETAASSVAEPIHEAGSEDGPGNGDRDGQSNASRSTVLAPDLTVVYNDIAMDFADRLGPTAICQRCNELSEQTHDGLFTALLKVHYIDASVLVVLFHSAQRQLPEAWQVTIGVQSMLRTEVDVNGVAVASANNLDDAMLMTRADLRPALLLPHGTRSEATATITGHTLVDTLMKFLDGEPAAWELFERAEARLPDFDLNSVARNHAAAALGGVRKSGSRSQPAKKESWTNINDEVVDVVSAFVAAARNNELQSALDLLGLDDE